MTENICKILLNLQRNFNISITNYFSGIVYHVRSRQNIMKKLALKDRDTCNYILTGTRETITDMVQRKRNEKETNQMIQVTVQ